MKLTLTSLSMTLCLSLAAMAQDAGGAARDVRPGETVRVEVSAKPETGGGGLLTPWWKDVVSLLTLLSIVIAGVGAFEQLRKNRVDRHETLEQRKTELRWKKAGLAREMLGELFEDPYATDAMLMLDWDGRRFCVKAHRSQAGGELKRVSTTEMWAALRVTELSFDDKEEFIRDCFDAFFGHMQIIEHYIRINLIELEDVTYPFEYYLFALNKNRPTFDTFIRLYHPRAAVFMALLESRRAGEAKSPPDASRRARVLRAVRGWADARLARSETNTAGPSPRPCAPAAEEIPAEAFFIYDSPPGGERRVIAFKNAWRIEEARAVLRGDMELGDSDELSEKLGPSGSGARLLAELPASWVYRKWGEDFQPDGRGGEGDAANAETSSGREE